MKKLYLSKKDKMLAGICAGIGEMLDVDPTIIRLAFVFIGIATAIFPLVIAYIIGWIIIPENPEDIAT
ncbi:MAG: PspC domain-containing protein [Calditrichaceae bacterium]